MKRKLTAAMAGILLLTAQTVTAGGVPPSIKTTAPVRFVNCAGPCCCGEVSAIYMGHYYADPSYCKWFRPLREGQNVTTTLYLWR